MFHEKQFPSETLYFCFIMARKRWTPKTDVTDSLLLFREKRKWQIALRRYVLEQNTGSSYAPYFGLDCSSFRAWLELQFDDGTNWDNFSKGWQFDHIVPVAYFDFNDDSDLRLCWHFTNIRVEKISLNKNRGHRIDVLASKAYFQRLFERTGYHACQAMIEKIERIEVSEIKTTIKLEDFLIENKRYLETISSFSAYEYSRLNEGIDAEKILTDRSFFNRLGL